MKKIKKLKICSGTFWIEIPDADLRILCGCPADSIKHLAKMGLLQSKKVNNVPFETGPNAILLSDLIFQNERLSNLSEFPVLHMLYKQGLIIPNHPNNTGAKPLLIGAEDSVHSQMEYIFRGNYGLISKEEILASGADEQFANDNMRLKLKFAYGSILPTDKLLDKVIVNEEKIEIRNDVFIERTNINVFLFHYGKESVEIDLNLGKTENYPSPFSLPSKPIKKKLGQFSVIHSGAGDGWNPNEPCMASIIVFQNKKYLVDAGPNVFCSLTALDIDIQEIEGIFQTHVHDDHFGGLPSLINKNRKLKYFAPMVVTHSAMKKFAALMSVPEKAFFDYFEAIDLKFDVWNEIEEFEVKPIFSPHPVENAMYIFRSRKNGDSKTIAHYADVVGLPILENMITNDPLKNGISRELFDKVKQNYLSAVTIKKVDVGGGMIHGFAEDFIQDQSQKLFLCHTSGPLTPEQKKIGLENFFGTYDVLIP